MGFSEQEFKHCMGAFATGVTVATTLDSRGKPVGVTINSFASVSLHPPMVLFCLDKNSASFPHFLEAKHFTINILTKHQVHLSRHFSLPGHKWEGMDFALGATKCPVLPSSLAYIECEKEVAYEGGDHLIFIGKVLHLNHSTENGEPLLYHHGQYINI